MQPLALFDLDDTLIDRRAAFNAWAEEFAAAHHLDDIRRGQAVWSGMSSATAVRIAVATPWSRARAAMERPSR